MEQQVAATYKFGPFLLEPAERRITNESVAVEMTAKAFDLLVLLVMRRGRLVTKEEMLGTVWGDVSVTESNLTTTISAIRKALSDDGSQFIETIPKKGYRFVADVQEIIHEAMLVEGVSDKQVTRKPLKQLAAPQWPKLVGIALVVLVAVAIAGWLFRSRPLQTAEGQYRRAVELDRQGNDKLALETLNQAIRIKPDFPDASLKAAWIAYQDDADDEAVKYVQHAVGSSSAEPRTAHGRCTRLKAQGLQTLLSGNSDDALSKFQLASETDPTDTDALSYLAATAADAGLLDDAERSSLKCLALDRNNPFCTFQMMEIRVRQNRFDEAAGGYDRASKQGLVYPWLEEPVGYAELAKGNSSAALSHFHRLESDGRQLASGVHFRASQDGIAAVYLFQGRLKDARSQVMSALQTARSPYDKAAYYLFLARLDALHGRMAEARQEVQSALENSQSDDLSMFAARVLAVAGDYDAAHEVLRLHQQASSNIGRPYAATQQFVNGMEAVALKHDLRRGVTELADAHRFDSDPEIAFYLARAQMQAVQTPDAIQTFSEILGDKGSVMVDSLPSLIPLTEFNLGICYRQLGNRTEAAKHFAAVETMWDEADPELKRVILPR